MSLHLLFGIALASPLPLHIQSPVPVHVFVDGTLIGTSWMEKELEVQLTEGQVLKLVCGETAIEPPPFTIDPLRIITHQVIGPCEVGGGDTPKLYEILGTPGPGTDDQAITDLWVGGGLNDLDEALGIPRQPEAPAPPSPPGLKVTGLDCTEGCEHPNLAGLRAQVRRYAGQLKYCAERFGAEAGELTLVLETGGGAVKKATTVGAPGSVAGCMDAKMRRWKVPADAPERTTWKLTLSLE